MLTPIGWMLPLALTAIPAGGIAAGLLPLTLITIPAIGIPMLVQLALTAIPAVGMAGRLMPLTVIAMPTIGLAPRLLPAMRLTKSPRLGPIESLPVHLPAKAAIRSGLGAQGAQRHKQTHRENKAPPSFWSHLFILL